MQRGFPCWGPRRRPFHLEDMALPQSYALRLQRGSISRKPNASGSLSPSGTRERRPHAFEADVVAVLAHDAGSTGVFSKPRAMRLGKSRCVRLVLRRPRDYAAGVIAGDTGMDADKPRQHGAGDGNGADR